jgi:hypothetical protein
MWLLNAKTYQLHMFQRVEVPYTILSHTWEDEDVLFRDLDVLDTATRKKGWKKIEYLCT